MQHQALGVEGHLRTSSTSVVVQHALDDEVTAGFLIREGGEEEEAAAAAAAEEEHQVKQSWNVQN